MVEAILPLFFCLFGVIAVATLALLVTSIQVVPEYKRLSVFRLGRYLGERGPGLVLLMPIIDRAIPIDTRDQLTKIQAQQGIFGAIGETKTLVHHEGNVEVVGQIWNAVSSEPIPPNTRVRIAKVVLEVERL